MATASDDFNRANGSMGANWQLTCGSGVQISSNGVVPVGFSEAGHHWIGSSFGADQYSQVQKVTTGGHAGVSVRCAPGKNGVYWISDGNVRRMVSSTVTTLGSFGTFANGDTVRLQITGTLIEGFKNGVSVGTINDASAPSSGAPGILFINNLDGAKVDNWEGGDPGGRGPDRRDRASHATTGDRLGGRNR